MRSPKNDGEKFWVFKPFIKNTVLMQKEWKIMQLSQKILIEKKPNSNPICPQIPAFLKKAYCLGSKIFWWQNFYSFFPSLTGKTFHSISCKIHCFCCFHANYLYLHEHKCFQYFQLGICRINSARKQDQSEQGFSEKLLHLYLWCNNDVHREWGAWVSHKCATWARKGSDCLWELVPKKIIV